jgi:hypothetical protein
MPVQPLSHSGLMMQVVLVVPLLLPYHIVHGPSIAAFGVLTKGAGQYVGGTLFATAVLILATSAWEWVQVSRKPAESDHKCGAASCLPDRAAPC